MITIIRKFTLRFWYGKHLILLEKHTDCNITYTKLDFNPNLTVSGNIIISKETSIILHSIGVLKPKQSQLFLISHMPCDSYEYATVIDHYKTVNYMNEQQKEIYEVEEDTVEFYTSQLITLFHQVPEVIYMQEITNRTVR